MSNRRDICVPRKKKDGSTHWTKIGTAWFNDNGGIQLLFDALPLPDAEGRCVANLFAPRDNSGDQQRQTTQQRSAAPDDLDDSVPF